MNPWDKFKIILNNWGQPLWPDAKPLPDHVKNMPLNMRLINIHMQECVKPKRKTGFKFDES